MRFRAVLPGVLVALAATAIVLWATWESSLPTWEMVIRIEPARSSPAPYIPGVWFSPNAHQAIPWDRDLARSPRVIQPAVNDPQWVAAKKDSPRDPDRFRERLTISRGKDPRLITVRFSDEDAEVARIGLEAFERSCWNCFGWTSRRPARNGRDLRTRVMEQLKAALATNDDPELRAEYQQMLKDDERLAAMGKGVTIVSRRLVPASR